MGRVQLVIESRRQDRRREKLEDVDLAGSEVIDGFHGQIVGAGERCPSRPPGRLTIAGQS
jgi:hypothetical protein